jgi:hypothetical protein
LVLRAKAGGALPESLSGWGEARDSHDWHTTPAQAGVQLGRSM